MATTLKTVLPSSDFMAAAAESADTCTEYCSISTECNYFLYDARKENTDHICILQLNNGTGPLQVCCEDNHYMDEAQTTPGWTVGVSPRTRRFIDNAKVLVSPRDLIADSGNGYRTQFEVSLGSSPLRGAVWVEPTVAASTKVDVSFWPRQVVLYDNSSSVTVTVWVPASVLENDFTSMNLVTQQDRLLRCSFYGVQRGK